MGTQPPDLKAVFDQAAEIDSAAERDAFLTAACAGFSDFRHQVEALLSALNQAGSFLEKPHPAVSEDDGTAAYVAPADVQSTDSVGSVIAGKYKLLQLVGKGGMGAVYMADQLEPVKRRVAVKLISSERGNSKTILSRFEAERQAIALMDHPSIAKLLDAGETSPTYVGGSSSPFFVMELVKGIPLTDYCDEHRLSILDRLYLFTQICSAVQHAHQKGIIHRDLKPTNILVESHDDKPVPKVIDFGLAKATSGMQLSEHTLFTALGTVAGTPLYMAPEQAKFNAIDIDTRADIYALGVILYELLTGTTPIERATLKQAAFDEILRVVRELEPPTPSKRLSSTDSKPTVAANRQTEPAKLGRFVRGELDWIVMKALSKERDRRYETANGFAKDIERFLKHEAVLAGPPSARYKLRKFVQRNRPQVVAGSLVLLALLVGIAGTTFGLVRAEKQRKKAEQAEIETLDAYKASTDDAIEQLIGSKHELGLQERIYVEKTRERWQAFASRQGDDERSLAIRGEGHYRVALLWAKLGRDENALAEFQAALILRQKLAQQFPDVTTYQKELAVTHNGLGITLYGLGNGELARAEYIAARDIQQTLVVQRPAEPEYQQDLVGTHSNLGLLLAGLGMSEEARAEYETARDLQKKLVDQFTDVPKYLLRLATVHDNLGNLLSGLGKWAEARAETAAAIQIGKKLVDRFPDVPAYQQHLATSHNNLGVQLRNRRKSVDAQTQYGAALDIQKALVEQFPAMSEFQLELARTHANLGVLFRDLERREEALAEFKAARDIQRKLVARSSGVPRYQQELADNHDNIGILLYGIGKREEARMEYQSARDIRKKLVEKLPGVLVYRVNLGGNYCNYGNLIRDEGKPAESLEWFDLAIRTLQPVHEKERRDVNAKIYLRISHQNRAVAYDLLQKPTEAAKDWDRAIELSPPAEQPRFRANRATSLLQAGKVSESIAEVAELTAPAADATGSPKWNSAQLYDFACVYAVASSKIPDKKQEYADRAMELLQKAMKAGYKDAAHMAKDTDLDSLRGREDFKKLMAELEKKSPPKPELAPPPREKK